MNSVITPAYGWPTAAPYGWAPELSVLIEPLGQGLEVVRDRGLRVPRGFVEDLDRGAVLQHMTRRGVRVRQLRLRQHRRAQPEIRPFLQDTVTGRLAWIEAQRQVVGSEKIVSKGG